MENTFVMIKPDAVQRNLIGNIISRFERKGLKLRAIRFLQMKRSLAEQLYDVHNERPFYNDLVNFATSGPVVVMIWNGPNAIMIVRRLLGETKSFEAQPGTIRGDFGLSVEKNIIHASDAADRAEYEYNLFFRSEELIEWSLSTEKWF